MHYYPILVKRLQLSTIIVTHQQTNTQTWKKGGSSTEADLGGERQGEAGRQKEGEGGMTR